MSSPADRETPARVLVRATNWLGDVVMSLPALRALRGAYPAARLAVLVRRELASLFDGADWIDEVIPYSVSRGPKRLAGVAAVVGEIRRRRFDLAVVFPSSFESALWPFLAGVPRRVGYVRDARGVLLTARARPTPEIRAAHQVHWYLHLLRETLGIEASAIDPRLDVHAPARDRMRHWLADRRRRPGVRLVALAPGAAYGPAKEWPAARFAELIDELDRLGAEVVLVGAPSERGRCREVAAQSRAGALVAAGETSVGDLSGLLSLCDAFAGNDSGAMHVAGALGVPTIGIFGSTSAERTGPLGVKTRVHTARIACSPCFDRTCRFGHYACFDETSPAAVLASLEALAARDA
jgi:heptosyltransferase-2